MWEVLYSPPEYVYKPVAWSREPEMGLLRYVAVRALLIIPTVLILYTIVFMVLRILPGDPILAMLGTRSIPPEQLESLRKQLGLDKPLVVQYFDYLWNVLHGDFGTSFVVRGRSIAADIAQRLPATIELSIAALLVSLGLGILTGLIGAVKRDTKIDSAMRVYGAITYTLFIPWLGLLLQLVFSVWLHLFPSSGRVSPGMEPHPYTGLYIIDSLVEGRFDKLADVLAHLALPAITLGIVLSGPYTRLVRNSLIAVLESDFILAYHARGIRSKKIMRHAFRNALIPVATYAGLQLALLLGGAVLTETTFSWPGLGTYLVDAITYRDYPAVQAVIIVYAFAVGLISLIVDILYAIIDPRVRF